MVALKLPCPLTSLQNRLRTAAGGDPLPFSGLIDHHIAGPMIPGHRTGAAQLFGFAAAAAAPWFVFARRHVFGLRRPGTPVVATCSVTSVDRRAK